MRHTAEDSAKRACSKDIVGALEHLLDLFVSLRSLKSLNDSGNLEQRVGTFFAEYYEFFCALKWNIFVFGQDEALIEEIIKNYNSNICRDSCALKPYEAPQSLSIEWYKEHSYQEFLSAKIIQFTSGPYACRDCKIVRFNGKNTRCLFLDDSSLHCISVKIALRWRDE